MLMQLYFSLVTKRAKLIPTIQIIHSKNTQNIRLDFFFRWNTLSTIQHFRMVSKGGIQPTLVLLKPCKTSTQKKNGTTLNVTFVTPLHFKGNTHLLLTTSLYSKERQIFFVSLMFHRLYFFVKRLSIHNT